MASATIVAVPILGGCLLVAQHGRDVHLAYPWIGLGCWSDGRDGRRLTRGLARRSASCKVHARAASEELRRLSELRAQIAEALLDAVVRRAVFRACLGHDDLLRRRGGGDARPALELCRDCFASSAATSAGSPSSTLDQVMDDAAPTNPSGGYDTSSSIDAVSEQASVEEPAALRCRPDPRPTA